MWVAPERASGRRIEAGDGVTREVEQLLLAVDVGRVTLSYNGTTVLERGAPLHVEPDVSNGSCRIELDLGLGEGSASYLTSDLSYDYVRINADYRT